jgi:c(7)-type cytochrome triheme protein
MLRFLPLFLVVFVIACSTKTRSIFFDIPPPSREELAQQQLEAQQAAAADSAANGRTFQPADEEAERPAVESAQTWEEVTEQLPEHALGGVDWVEALEEGLVKPRPGPDSPDAKYAAAFKYDFIIEGKKPKFNAIFPHSAHTGWVGCENCHTSLYPYKRNPARMKDMRKGASCGACHGSVAFNLKQCKRCHLEM